MSQTLPQPQLAGDHRRLFFDLLSDTAGGAARADDGTLYTPQVVTWLMVFQRLQADAPLAAAVDEFVLHVPRPPGRPAPSANTGGYSRARSRLPVAAAREAADRVAAALTAPLPPAWDGLPCYILDGTTLQLAPTPALRRAYPPAANQAGTSAWPILQVLVAHELDTGLALPPAYGPMYGPDPVSELALALRLLPQLPEKAVILADRNFGVFALAYAAVGSGRHLVARLTRPRWDARRRGARADGPGRWRVAWRPTRADRRTHPGLPADAAVECWVYEIAGVDGTPIWVLATGRWAAAEVGALYRRRVAVETDLGNLKVTLAMDRLSGRTPGMVEKELLLGVLAYNLAGQVRRLAAAKAGVPPRALSFAGTWSVLRTFLSLLATGLPEPQWQERFEVVLTMMGQRKLPNRRPGRSYPREVIPRRSRYPERKPKPLATKTV